MKRMILLALLLCSTVTAGTYDKDIQIGAGGVGLDSVVAIVEVNNVRIDSVLWKVFAVDSFITLPDTAIVTIAWFYFFTDDASATIKFTTAYEQIPAGDKTESVYNNVVGFYVVDTISGDSLSGVSVTLKDAGNNARNNPFLTNSDGFNQANLVTGNWTFIATRPPDSFRDTTINITANDTILIRGGLFSIGSPANADLSRVHGFLRTIEDKKIDGATVIATFHSGSNQTDSTGTAVIVADIVAEASSDSTGYFFLDLRRTTTYPDTSRGFYDIRGYWDEELIFEVLKLYIPVSGNINLADTLANRP